MAGGQLVQLAANSFKEGVSNMENRYWRSIMDPEQNALSGLPKPVKFQLMVTLALMWSTIFCTSAGIIAWLPGYVLVHVALIFVGLFGTGWVFRAATKDPVPVRVLAKDGTPDRD